MSMVERVARAIADPILKEFDGFRLDKEVEWDKLPEARDQATLLRIARAAIEEMREPTHAMSREFFIAWTMAERRGFDFPESPVVYAWNRMIDAMLDDGTSAALGEGE